MPTDHEEYSSISPTDQGTDYWATRDFLTEETRDAIKRASIVVVPHENFREEAKILFPVGTTDFFNMLQERASAEVNVEIAAEDEHYQEIALHFDVIRLPMMVVEWAILPLVAAWVAEYLRDKLGSRIDKAEVEASLIVERNNSHGRRAFQLDYKGPAHAFEETVKGDLAKMVGMDQSEEHRD